MPVVPLFETPADPDAWHRVAAPGGYEWWYFDAEDATGRFQLVAIFFEGFVFHPGYLRRYARYLRRPTRRTPPVAGDFPCAYFVLYEDGKIRSQFMAQYPPSEFRASADRPDVRVGPNTFRREKDGSLRLELRGTPWQLTWRGPMLLDGQTLSADLTFRPLAPAGATERTFLSRRLSGADHRGVIADPLCEVTGTISMDGGASAGGPTVVFTGRGYHDHNYGTAPIGPGLKRWVWGRAIADDGMYTFHFARPADGRLPDEVHLIRADAAGQHVVAAPAASLDWDRRTGFGLAYPSEITFSSRLRLTHPRVVDSAPFYMRLVYDAAIDGGARSGRAFCEVAYPHRLRWPVIGRMIEMSIFRPRESVPSR
jgi:carotenoid 1,2-hydratase